MKKAAALELGAATSGATLGGMAGSGLGLVGAFGGVSAAIPLAIIAGLACWGYTRHKHALEENRQLKAELRAKSGKSA